LCLNDCVYLLIPNTTNIVKIVLNPKHESATSHIICLANQRPRILFVLPISDLAYYLSCHTKHESATSHIICLAIQTPSKFKRYICVRTLHIIERVYLLQRMYLGESYRNIHLYWSRRYFNIIILCLTIHVLFMVINF
jgi:hypothetical protein